MYGKISVSVGPGREYIAYVNGRDLEIVARIDGHTARLGPAQWDGRRVVCGALPIRSQARAALAAAIEVAERSTDDPHS
jgi:hypothetical protein